MIWNPATLHWTKRTLVASIRRRALQCKIRLFSKGQAKYASVGNPVIGIMMMAHRLCALALIPVGENTFDISHTNLELVPSPTYWVDLVCAEQNLKPGSTVIAINSTMVSVGGIGAKLLSKMGWSEGTGLGANRDGNVEPLGAPKRPEKLGIGAELRPFKDAWWENMMEEAYGKAKADGDNGLLVACEGRRCRPHGSAKLARLEAHDRMVAGDGKVVEKRRKKKSRKLKVLKDGIKEKKKKKKEKKGKSKKVKEN